MQSSPFALDASEPVMPPPHSGKGAGVAVAQGGEDGLGSVSSKNLSLLDDPQEWPLFGHAWVQEPGAWESQVTLGGMYCATCSFTIERALAAVPGVLQVQVNAATQRARVVWRPDAVLPSQWVRAIQQAGYSAVPAHDAQASELRQREQRRALWRWLVAGLCMMQVMMYVYPGYVTRPGEIPADVAQLLIWAAWVLSIPVMLFSCTPFFVNAWRDIRMRQVSMDLPVALGMVVTFVVSTVATFDPQGVLGHETYFDSLTMFVFFLLTGRWLELRLRDRTAGALDALMNRLPDSVLRRTSVGELERVVVRRLRVGDVVQILPGESFPADGCIVEGSTQVDEALLTGESRPVTRSAGGQVIAGSFNLSAAVLVKVQKLGADTRFAEVVGLMERAAVDKPRLALLADRIARPFLWAVLLAAVLSVIVWWPSDPGHALMVGVAVLVVTCPCALSLATPAAMLASAGVMARQGMLVRNLQALESLAGVDTVVFDKTGTLTRDGMTLHAVRTRKGITAEQALAVAAGLAQHSLHPVSRALVQALESTDKAVPKVLAWGVSEVSGQGLRGRSHSALVQGELRLGRASWCGVPLDQENVSFSQQVHVADEQGWWATFELHEDIRADAASTVAALKRMGLNVQVLSGDRLSNVQHVGAAIGIDANHVRGGCTPAEKLAHLQALQKQGHKVVMVGDGLNDGPVLAGAHASFAFGQAVALAQSQSDFVVMGAELKRVYTSVVLARQTMKIVRQNLWWSAAYNAVCVPFAVMGLLPPWLAGLGMALSSLLVVLNASRLSWNVKNRGHHDPNQAGHSSVIAAT